MKKVLSGKNSRLLLACACLVLAGCMDEVLTTIPALHVSDKGVKIPESWFRFGAYYVADDVILSVNLSPAAGGNVTEYTVFKSVRILNQQGMHFATIPVPQYTKKIIFFSMDVLTPDSVCVPVNTSEIRRKFEETGKVVAPRAEPGSLISVKIVFSSEKAPAVHEHWFLRSIPVQTGRFVVHTDDGTHLSYKYQVYGTRSIVENYPVQQSGGTGTAWIVRNLDPLDSISFRPPASESEPRVALRASPLFNENRDTITSWQMFARWMYKWRIDPALFGSSGDVDEKTKEITAGIKGDSACAETIVAWLQNNIMCSRAPLQATVGDVLKKLKSDPFLAGLLCREMLKSIGIKADLVLTRSQELGGFDPKFLSFYPCQDGLVVIHLNGHDRCVSPVFPGYPVGAYPADYFGVSGLSMEEGKIVDLPPPLWAGKKEGSKSTLDFSRDSAVQTYHLEINDLSTVMVRKLLYGKSETQQRDIVRKLLQAKGKTNTLVSFAVKNLAELRMPLVIDARFTDNGGPEEIAGAFRHDLSRYFPRFFAGIDSSRRQDISVTVPARSIDTVEILKSPAINVAFDATPWTTKNRLFDASVKVQQGNVSALVIRDVDRHACTIPAANIAGLMKDIEGLERAGKVAAVVTRRR